MAFLMPGCIPKTTPLRPSTLKDDVRLWVSAEGSWPSAIFRYWHLIGCGKRAQRVACLERQWQCAVFSLEGSSPQEGGCCSLMHDSLRVHNAPEHIPVCWPCLSFRLICCTAIHVETNAYPAPGQLQLEDVSNPSTIRRLLHLPLELPHLTLGLGETLTVVLTFSNVLTPRTPLGLIRTATQSPDPENMCRLTHREARGACTFFFEGLSLISPRTFRLWIATFRWRRSSNAGPAHFPHLWYKTIEEVGVTQTNQV